MKFGIFLLMQSPDMLPSSEIYANALEQTRMADQLGFDYVVAAEHHFSSYGFLPSPLMLISTLAQHTERVRFSTAVVVLPLRNPIQTAKKSPCWTILPRAGWRWDLAPVTSSMNFNVFRYRWKRTGRCSKSRWI